MNFITRSKRIATYHDEITKVILCNVNTDGHMIAKRVYYEIKKNGRTMPAIDYMSALVTLYE